MENYSYYYKHWSLYGYQCVVTLSLGNCLYIVCFSRARWSALATTHQHQLHSSQPVVFAKSMINMQTIAKSCYNTSLTW